MNFDMGVNRLLNLMVMLVFILPVRAQSPSPCDSFFVRIEPLSGSLLFCPETVGAESFRGVAGYDVDTIEFNPASLIYRWEYDGHEFEGSLITRTYEIPGAYPFTLRVEDPDNMCVGFVTEVVKVGTIPTFSGTIPTLNVACADDQFSLIGVANPTTWTGFPTSVRETVPIPQNAPEPYESSLEFDVFNEGDVIRSAADIDRICLNIDHVNHGPLWFEIECPNGTTVTLKSYDEGGANLGEPVVWDNITPGKGYEYCFTPAPLFGLMNETNPEFHAYTDMAGNYYFNAMYLPAGSYTPDQPLETLAGCPLNGKWTIRVADRQEGLNGYIHGWSLFFDESFYPDSLIFTPEIVKEQWYLENSPIQGNPSQQTISQEGDYLFRFEVEDNFGCTYDTVFTVTILPLPLAEILSDLEMPVCEGDSTILRISPLSGSVSDWMYQWQLAGNEFPGRIFDTLMAREPAAYGIMITDTVTGCQNVFNFDFSNQNCDLTIPNVFTPNADGINDVFEVLNLEHYPMAQIVVFNRWGKKVFEHSDYYNNWWNGNGHPDGVYFYVIKYSRMGEVKHAEGSVTIIR